MIRMFKLVSNEFIMGEVSEENEKKLMSSPMIVNYKPHESGQLALSLFPANPFAATKDECIPINDCHVLFEIQNIQEGLQAEYLRITSGLVTITNKFKK
jgi:hypothetical protein